MNIMIKACCIVYGVILLMNLAFIVKADHEDDQMKLLRGHFIFGDSQVDAGNNDHLLTLTNGKKWPNGIDFKPSDGKPTGRYTNARTVVDIIGEELGQPKYAIPYLSLSSDEKAIPSGINYAAGAAGILNFTGKTAITTLAMDTQVNYFNVTRQQLDILLGPSEAKKLIMEQSIFSIYIGANDFLANYKIPVIEIASRIIKSPDDFIHDMIKSFKKQLTRLYLLDARKFMVANIGPIGCIPYQRKMNQGHCVDSTNDLAKKYNQRLKILIDELNQNLKGSTFVYANLYDIEMEIGTNYDKFGFITGSEPCYDSNQVVPILPIRLNSKLCSDRSKYVFWDTFHTTEAANLIISKQLLDGELRYISPINLRQLRDR